MSTAYYIGCDKCKKKLHISQGRGEVIYSGDKKCMEKLGLFLKEHGDCERLFYADEHQFDGAWVNTYVTV